MMQSGFPNSPTYPVITLTCDESTLFNRRLLSLVKQWDKAGKVRILSNKDPQSKEPSASSAPNLCVSDESGERWYGAEAVPIIFKNLPFGKLAAAMYILPGTMWFTKQIYGLDKPVSGEQLKHRLH
jgi:hypothetical protein